MIYVCIYSYTHICVYYIFQIQMEAYYAHCSAFYLFSFNYTCTYTYTHIHTYIHIQHIAIHINI